MVKLPLHLAAATAELDVLQCVMDACPEAAAIVDRNGKTALDVALASKQPTAMVMYLLPGGGRANKILQLLVARKPQY